MRGDAKMKIFRKTLIICGLFCALFIIGCAKPADSLENSKNPNHNGTSDSFKLDVSQVTADLKADFIDSLNKDLVKEIADLKKDEEVGVIITLSDQSLVSDYLLSSAENFEAYSKTKAYKVLQRTLFSKQKQLIELLEQKRLVKEVKYQYETILDGIYVRTKASNVQAITQLPGVERVMVSNTYDKPDAVTNPVQVYDTGIFDSSDVKYTGKGTIVAVLDTGCDYTHTAFTTHEVIDPLYSRDDIEGMLDGLFANRYTADLETRDVYYSSKIPYGYDYADKDPDIMPYESEHGTHVAGIIGGYDDTICGVAIDTQLAIMKVFSDYKQGAEDGDILAALEDSVKLGVDAINMSLGTSCGFTREEDEAYKSEIYDNIEKAGISLVVAASNDHSSAYGSEQGNTNKASNPDSATVGSPSTYHAALSVASINGNMDKYMLANGNQTVFFLESFNQSAKEYNFYEMLGIPNNQSVVYDYVTVPGFGLSANYTGLDIQGKIALVKRGDISFEEKVQYAYEAGAIACIVYNNVFGDIVMTVGNNLQIPTVSISKDDGVKLASVPSGKIEFNMNNIAGPFMSDFSSWGPTPNLELKPEITAHGGNILSAIPGGGYDKLSGTSMACPNMCGVAVLVRQYVKEKFPGLSTTEIRDMVNQLVTSTATIALDRLGNPYSPRKQGAGLASLFNAVNTKAYLTVDGKNVAKAELGDDPKRTGVYEFEFNLINMSNQALRYDLSSVVMTETLSSSDEEYVAELGYILDGKTSYAVSNGTLNGTVCEVAAGATSVVKVKITLSDADKNYLNRYFKNGMYVEGFIKLKSLSNDVDLNIPYLAFYGDWSEAPIFDLDYYTVETESHNNAIDDEDKIKADYYATKPLGKYYYDYIIPLGSYVYTMDESLYNPIPATMEHAAVSYFTDCISGIYGVFTGLLRGAKELSIEIKNELTGEVIWENTEYNCYKSHYSGAPRPYYCDIDLEAGDLALDNNAKYVVTMKAKLDWNSTENNLNDSYSFSFYVDYETPRVLGANYRKVYDKSEERYHYFVDLEVYDNHYVQSIRPVVLYTNEATGKLTYTSLTNNPIPVYQKNRGEKTIVEVEITDYMDIIKETNLSEGLAFHIDDYAMNSNIYYISLPELDSKNLAFTEDTLEVSVNDTFDLRQLMKVNGQEGINTDYLGNLSWTSTNPSVVKVSGGQIEALQEGKATILCESIVTHKRISIVINVAAKNDNDNPLSGANVGLEDLKFVSYNTLFAFESDNDHSEIGLTGSINFFDTKPSISCYPSESVKLNYVLKPWNLNEDRYTLSYSSSNEKVAQVDKNGVVTAVGEGKARISLRITIDGKTSTLVARCEVTVKSPFIVENRILTEYKGLGGDVVIPDDLGIMYIGSFAFCHYKVDNTIEPEDPDDFDSKKIPFGNDTITSVVIPEGVEEIQKYAFYQCTALRRVNLPTSCTKIYEYAFYNDTALQQINLENVVVIAARTFYNCESLLETDTAKANTIGEEAFAKCKNIRSADLRELKRSGKNAFLDCIRLSTVLLGKWTKLSEGIFTNTRLTEVTVYSTYVPDQAFKGCERLTKISFENELTYLGDAVFEGCLRLENIEFKKGVEYMGTNLVNGCNALKTLTLPSSEVEIADYAFQNSGIEMVVFAKDTYIVSAGGSLFKSCDRLQQIDASASQYYAYKDGALYTQDLKTLMLIHPNTLLSIYNVPDSVEYIAPSAVSCNESLTAIYFSNSSQIKEIGANAFAECPNLQMVTLPNHDVTIGNHAFFYCPKLETVNVNFVTAIGDYAFSYTNVRSITIAEGATLGEGAFYQTSNLYELVLGANVQIGFGSFSKSGIVNVQMPEAGGVVIGDQAFALNQSLMSIDLTKATGKIGDAAFYNCSKLTSIAFDQIEEIGDRAFADCTRLETVELGTTLTKIGESAFAQYATGSTSGAAFTSLVFPDSLVYIGADAFHGCRLLESIDLNQVTTIGEQAFAYCVQLASVTLGEGLKHLSDSIFYGCSQLVSINLENVETIARAVFYSTGLEQINLANVTRVDDSAFLNCGNLMEVYAPCLQYIGQMAFQSTGLTQIDLPALEEVKAQAFYQTKIAEFGISENLTSVEYTAFMGMDDLTHFYAYGDPNKQDTIAFSNVILDQGVLYTILPDGSYQLVQYPVAKTDETYTVLDGTTRLDYFSAAYNEYIQKVVFPTSLKAIANGAFYGCSQLNEVEFNSYYAPQLEGTMTLASQVKPTPETYEAFDILYGHDYYYFAGAGLQYYYAMVYQNFIDTVGKKYQPMTYIYPENSSGYDSILYTVYFKDKVDEEGNRITTGFTMDNFAINFNEAIKLLPDTVTFKDETVIRNARTAYNALLMHEEQLSFISQEDVAKLIEKETALNVLLMNRTLERIYVVENSKYSYDQIKAAYLQFSKLTKEEVELLENASQLDEAIAKLEAAMKQKVDFNKEYNEYEPVEEQPEPTPTPEPEPKNNTAIIVVSILGGILVIAGGVVLVLYLLKKKGNKK